MRKLSVVFFTVTLRRTSTFGKFFPTWGIAVFLYTQKPQLTEQLRLLDLEQ
jgi:hypothetical protein